MSSTNHELNKEQVEELKEAFSLFALNADGYLPEKQFGYAMRSLGWNPAQQEIEEMYNQVDDKEKGMSFPKFLEIMTVCIEKQENDDEESTFRCFQGFNPNSEGLVSLNSIRKALQKAGEGLVSPKDPDYCPLQYKNWDDE